MGCSARIARLVNTFTKEYIIARPEITWTMSSGNGIRTLIRTHRVTFMHRVREKELFLSSSVLTTNTVQRTWTLMPRTEIERKHTFSLAL